VDHVISTTSPASVDWHGLCGQRACLQFGRLRRPPVRSAPLQRERLL